MFLALYANLQNRLHAMSNERGASAVEYGLLIALIAAVLIGVLTALGIKIQDVFQNIKDALP